MGQKRRQVLAQVRIYWTGVVAPWYSPRPYASNYPRRSWWHEVVKGVRNHNLDTGCNFL